MTQAPLGCFEFDPRTRISFGVGAIEGLPEAVRRAGGTRVLVVTDPGIVRAGHAAKARAALEAGGMAAPLFEGVVENPDEACVDEALRAARSAGADALVAVGGGSAMDCAKATALLLACGGRPSDYRGIGKVPRDLPPVVAVPTTAGTGSEVQSAALISEGHHGSHEQGAKMLLWDRRLAPRTAILDPALGVTAPREVTALAGIDAVAHAVESHVSTRASAFSRVFAREAFRLLAGAFERTVHSPGDVEARGEMLLGACLAGLSIEHSMLGAAHSCANPLTARRGAAHGLAVGILLPHVVRFNGGSVDADARYGELLAALNGCAPATASVASASGRLAIAIEGLLESAGLPKRLRDIAVVPEDLEPMSREAEAQWTARFNPRPVGAAELLELYRRAL